VTASGLRAAEEFEQLACGPTSSAVVLAGQAPEIFLKVEWTPALQRVAAHAREHEDFECRARWACFSLGEKGRAYGLEIEWPDVPGTGTARFYFEPRSWDVELGMIRDAGGRLFLVSEKAEGVELLDSAIGVETPADDILTYYLASPQ
jgi:hypothetical protein